MIKTVPPAGVNPIYRQTWIDSVEAAKASGAYLVPQHKLVTRYNYNSLNQVTIQKTPDGGTSRFYYDLMGRLAVSQNAKQISLGNVYSYTKYDSLGRITEVGQITGGAAMTDATAKSASSLQSWLTSAANTRNQVTETVYDVEHAFVDDSVLVQTNLRNRVSYSQVYDLISEAPASGTLYSYDIHGNVDTLVQDFGNSAYKPNAMNQSGNRWKKIAYDYDLVSGKVNQVSYQPRQKDAYYHRYIYDAENRITEVITGRDSVMLFFFPERDAKYTYYKHGPLARTELGKLRVQGLDYAYTMQGWIKAINPVMGGTLANGTDSAEAYPVAQDVFGFSLNYYKNDYQAIGYNPPSTSIVGALTSNATPLYNGNISAMAVNIPQLGTPKVYTYKYDQLNRLVAMDVFNGLNVNAGSFTPVSITEYRERIAYDANGNILKLLRNGDAARNSMDNLSYHYKTNTNQLHKIYDSATDVSSANYSRYNDVRQGQADNNYQYDQMGNLVSDAKDSVKNITWTVYGKVQSYVVKETIFVTYKYDAAGNRIMKMTEADTTFYVRDAGGNILSIYTKAGLGVVIQAETHIYGNARLGMKTSQTSLDAEESLNGSFGQGFNRILTRGEKQFEISNHLGNVLATITDRKIQSSEDLTNVAYYSSEIRTANDYYSGGMIVSDRTYSSAEYRFSINGQEVELEVNRNVTSAEYWFYDSRTLRRWNIDPKVKHAESPYLTFGGNPIWLVDIDGRDTSLPKTIQVGASAKFFTGNVRANSPDDDLTKTYYPNQDVNTSLYDKNEEYDDNSIRDHHNRWRRMFTMATTLESYQAQNEASELMHHFETGLGLLKPPFGTNSEMSRILGADDQFIEMAKHFEGQAIEFLKEHGNLTGFNGSEVLREARSGKYIKDTWFMHAVMGGFQQVDVSIKVVSDKDVQFTYTIWDHYGAGKNDAGSSLPGLPSLYWLQHNSEHNNPLFKDWFKPFIWGITSVRKAAIK